MVVSMTVEPIWYVSNSGMVVSVLPDLICSLFAAYLINGNEIKDKTHSVVCRSLKQVNGGLQSRRRRLSKLTLYNPRNLMPFCLLSRLIWNIIIPLYNTRSTGAPAAEIIYICWCCNAEFFLLSHLLLLQRQCRTLMFASARGRAKSRIFYSALISKRVCRWYGVLMAEVLREGREDNGTDDPRYACGRSDFIRLIDRMAAARCRYRCRVGYARRSIHVTT